MSLLCSPIHSLLRLVVVVGNVFDLNLLGARNECADRLTISDPHLIEVEASLS
jgi:hypothetical protein